MIRAIAPAGALAITFILTPGTVGAETLPVNSAAVSSYIKVTSDDKLESASAFTCPDGNWLAGKYVKCFNNINEYEWTCEHTDCAADEVYNPGSASCIPIVDYGCVHTNNVLTMQNWHGCSDLTTMSPTTTNATITADMKVCLIDNRDGKTYEVRRMPDGRCWMATNLKYGGDYVDWKTADRDNCAHMLTSYWAIKAGGVYTDGFYNMNASTDTAQTNLFGAGTYGLCAIPYSTTAAQDSQDALAPSAASLYGYLYNWMAAVQNPCGWYGNSSCNPDSSATVKLRGLCPAGWHLPTGTVTGEQEYLADKVAGISDSNIAAGKHIADETKITAPTTGCYTAGSSCYVNASYPGTGNGNGGQVHTFFKPGGGYDTRYAGRTTYINENFSYDGATRTFTKESVALRHQGGYAYFWSSSARTANYAYYVYVDSGHVRPLGSHPGDFEYFGFSVRCLQDF
ncbi:hypothetical protein IJJ12_01590 [bacterium]|nr:hypothetical protein [bacterium]